MPKWLRSAPECCSPTRRPPVVSRHVLYAYDAAKATSCGDIPQDLAFDSRFESGNLLSATRARHARVLSFFQTPHLSKKKKKKLKKNSKKKKKIEKNSEKKKKEK